MPPTRLPQLPADPEIMIVAGEASGDHYGADLVNRVSEFNPHVKFFGMGGDRMAASGVELDHHIKEVSVMGFVEVLSRLRPLYRAFRSLVEATRTRRPNAIVLVDFPDFNLRLAAKLRQVTRAPILYYIGPTVWAWRAGRVEQIAKSIDKMLVIFPFEEEVYRKASVDVEFVGHPLVGTVKAGDKGEFCQKHGLDPDRPIVGLLPGSREKEIAQILPTLIQSAARLGAQRAELQFVIGLAESIERNQVDRLVGGESIRVIEHATHDVMKHSELLLTTCGTAPLEASMLGTPQVVVYKTTPLTFGIASRMVKVPHICMVNLILERRAVPELVQHDFTVERVTEEALRLLTDEKLRKAQIDDARELRQRMGRPGAARRAAQAVLARAGLSSTGHK